MKTNGNIDEVTSERIRGWIVADPASSIYLCINGEKTTSITNFERRNDVIDAGITPENCGFDIPLSDYLLGKIGDVEVSIWVEDNVVMSETVRIKSNVILNTNPWFGLESPVSIKDMDCQCNHRVGLSFNRFIAPKGLSHSNGYYTRFSFKDDKNTRNPLVLKPRLAEISSDTQSLQVALTGKASHDSNVHIRFVEKETGAILEDFPALMEPSSWHCRVFEVNEVLTSKLRNDEATILLVAKHHGKRFIDLSMFALVEDFSRVALPAKKEVKNVYTHHNLIPNGNLTKWAYGVDFSTLKRGQFLANNWLLEYHKQNTGKVAVAVKSDEATNDPLGASLNSKFGLRFRTAELAGYCRAIVPFDKSKVASTSYELSLTVEASGLKNSVLLHSLAVIARSLHNETTLHTLVKKQVVNNRQTLKFKLSAVDTNNILNSAISWNTLALAVEFSGNQDITIYGCELIECSHDDTVVADEKVSCDDVFFQFEDPCITEQLSLLKGLESWNHKVEGGANINEGATENGQTSSSGNGLGAFESVVHTLRPHKLARPSRSYPLIDIIVPVYNACDDVVLCLSALIEKTDLLHRVIVINDGEDTRTANMLAAFHNAFNHLEVITNPKNMGYTKSVNIGVKHSNADWVVVLNSDTIVSEGWLGKLMNCALSEENVGMVGALSNAASWQSVPHIHDENGDWHLNPLPTGISVDDMADLVAKFSQRAYPSVEVINGFCQLINMDMLDKIGLLDEQAFPVGYGEENDMCARAVKGGFKLLIADDTYVYHAKSKSFGHEKRKVLAKQGSIALKKKHPDVDWGAVTKKIFEHEALVALREELAEALSKK